MQPATFTLRRSLSGKTLKAWRNAHGYSAQALAVELGVTRQYIKSIEGGSLEASKKFISKFDALRERMGESVAPVEEAKPITIVSRFEMPPTIEILAKPRRCKKCHRWFVPVNAVQKSHTKGTCKSIVPKRKHQSKE